MSFRDIKIEQTKVVSTPLFKRDVQTSSFKELLEQKMKELKKNR